ncbi:MAG TPA: hypothetical protein VEH07_00045, partial [Alphaproteobacteria bacterium]|nr:hypothetical protein [Alphaproteobacteria bacterium]
IGQVFMGALILGLPIVLTLAWYHGHKGLKRFTAAEVTIVALLLVLIGGGFYVFVRSPHPVSERAKALSDTTLSHGEREARTALQPTLALRGEGSSQAQSASAPGEGVAPSAEGGVSLAVLPFADMSEKHDQDYFSDGLSEELLNQLAQIKDLRVAGRTSSFSFKGKNEDLRVIGEKLGVNHLLEGSVRKSGARLRITVQLINAADGTHLWSQTFDRELKDVFAVQEEIAMAVTDALSVTLGVGDMARLSTGGTTNTEAYDLYLRAGALAATSVPADITRARALYRQALALDPNFARAWMGLAVASNLSIVFVPETAAEASKEMSEAAAKVAVLAPDQATLHLLKAAQTERSDWAGREREWREALKLAPPSLELVPGVGIGFGYAVMLAAAGRTSEAVKIYEGLRQHDPLSLGVSAQLQFDLDSAGRFQEAEAEYQRSRDLAGNHGPWDFAAVMRIWLTGGDPAKAKALLDSRGAQNDPFFPLNKDLLAVYDQPQAARTLLNGAFQDPFYQDPTRLNIIGYWAAHYGDTDLVLKALRRGFVDKQGTVIQVLWHPIYAEARKDARFKAIVRDLGLYDYWRKTGKWSEHCHPLSADDFACE